MAGTTDKFRKDLEKLVRLHGGRGEFILIYPTSAPAPAYGRDAVETVISTNCDRGTIASILSQILAQYAFDLPKNPPEGPMH